MSGPHQPREPYRDEPYRDDAARRVGEALRAQARGRPMPPPRPGGSPPVPPPPPPRVPGRVPPPAPRPVDHRRPAPAPPPEPAGWSPRQIVWPIVIVLLVGAVLGGGLALVSILLPGALPSFG